MSMTERDLLVLRHVGRFRISIRPAIEKLFFGGKSCDNVLQRLRADGRLQNHRLGRTGISYYQLTRAQTRCPQTLVPENRALPFSAGPLHESLAVLWFCCLSEFPAERLEGDDLKRLFGKTFYDPHCLQVGPGGRKRVFRLDVPGSTSGDEYPVRKLVSTFEELVSGKDQVLWDWVKARDFGFSVLVETKERKDRLESLLAKEKLPGLVNVQLAPSQLTIKEALKGVL